MSVGLIVLVLMLSFAMGYGLYVLVRAEHDTRQTMDRERGERTARRDTPDRTKFE